MVDWAARQRLRQCRGQAYRRPRPRRLPRRRAPASWRRFSSSADLQLLSSAPIGALQRWLRRSETTRTSGGWAQPKAAAFAALQPSKTPCRAMSTPRLCRALGAAQAGGAHRRANELCPAASRAPGCAGGGARGGRACAGGLARGCPAAPRTVAQAAAVFQRGHAQKGAVLGLRALSTLSEVGSKRAIRESAGRQCITDSVLTAARSLCTTAPSQSSAAGEPPKSYREPRPSPRRALALQALETGANIRRCRSFIRCLHSSIPRSIWRAVDLESTRWR